MGDDGGWKRVKMLEILGKVVLLVLKMILWRWRGCHGDGNHIMVAGIVSLFCDSYRDGGKNIMLVGIMSC